MKYFAIKLALTGLALTGISACNVNGKNTTKLQYMPDMADGPITKAQRST
jgi:hypothetical protein